VSEEQRVRTLLAAAAELPGLPPVPVEHLIATGRRRRRRSRVLAAASAAVAVAVAATIPVLISGHSAVVSPPPGRLSAGSAEALAHDHWSQLQNCPLGAVNVAEWTGRELLAFEWDPYNTVPLLGAAYVPGAGWHRTAGLPARLDKRPIRTFGWAGTDLAVVYSGPGAEIALAIYSPATNQWRVTRTLSSVLGGALSPIRNGEPVEVAGDTGITMIGEIGDQIVLVREIRVWLYAYRYDLATGTWHEDAYELSPLNCAGSRCTWPNGMMKVAQAAGRIIVWWYAGGAGRVTVHEIEPDGSWRIVAGWPQAVTGFEVFSTDNGQIVLIRTITRGQGQNASETAEGYLVDPVTLRVRPLGFFPGDGYGQFEPVQWTGSALIAMAWGQHGAPPEQFFGGYVIEALDPVGGHWYRLRPGTIVDTFGWVGPIWGGGQLFVTNGHWLWSLHA
jgi:hypothetical protein